MQEETQWRRGKNSLKHYSVKKRARMNVVKQRAQKMENADDVNPFVCSEKVKHPLHECVQHPAS